MKRKNELITMRCVSERNYINQNPEIAAALKQFFSPQIGVRHFNQQQFNLNQATFQERVFLLTREHGLYLLSLFFRPETEACDFNSETLVCNLIVDASVTYKCRHT